MEEVIKTREKENFFGALKGMRQLTKDDELNSCFDNSLEKSKSRK